ncbi:ABC transporter substrate-binding protein [Colwellia sp. BRX10-3]|uniref:substrate-binding periplasmic protein n=1 Tax=Colwellia sp. BRX10-3 TaxID=2759844 RepID=UPI0015F364EA|nr:ABC transporter substrate-binding protein [Colwellia sp. BRX10-3]MBA6390274.1 ABC transporter substrate-binding protein [Colwellia sp. BRX10-3]
MKKLTVFTIFLMFAFYSQANTEYENVHIVTEHLAPYQIGENYELIGGAVGVQMQRLFNKVLPKNKIEVLPWARAYQIALDRPNTIIFSMVRTPERENKFIWIGKVAQVTTELITLKDSKLQPIKSLSELKGIPIGVKRLDAITTFLIDRGFQFNKELVEIINTFSTMQMLEKGRIEVIPSNKQIIDFYCQDTGCKNSDFKTIYTLKELSEEFYLAVSLGTDENLVKQLRAEFPMLDLPVQ